MIRAAPVVQVLSPVIALFGAAMLLGRLELFTLLVVFTPAFWRR